MDEEQEERKESMAQRMAGGFGRLIGANARPSPIIVRTPPSAVVPSTSHDNGGELEDLFAVPEPEDNDIRTDDLLELDEEDIFGGPEDMSDILSVSREDVINGNDKPKPKLKLVRTNKPYPSAGLTGLR